MLKVAILDDYQNVAQEFVDLKKLSGKYEIKIFSEPFENEEDAIKNLKDFEALLIMRERTRITSNLINSIKKDNTKSNVSFSWEDEAQISIIKKLKININDWEKILPIKIKKMLLAESSRGLPYVQFLYNRALSLGIPWRFLISKNYIKKSFSKTYYASRRFTLPKKLLAKTAC